MPAAADRDALAAEAFSSLADLLHYRAAAQPHDRAYVVLSDRGREEAGITFAAFERRAIALARRIVARAAPGERALLLCPTGIEFLGGLFGCVLAGIIAVPMMLPRRQSARDASAGIVADCAPRLALTLRALIDGERGDLVGRFAASGLEWLAFALPLPSSRPPRLPHAPVGHAFALSPDTSRPHTAPHR